MSSVLLFTPVVPSQQLLASLKPRKTAFHNYNKPFYATKARWVVEAENRQPNDPVFIYFHGGGYCFPLLDTHIKFLIHLYKTLKDPRFSILILDYSLAPEHVYPTQLIEAATVYKDLVDKDKCTRILLSGDSAGGNLATVLTAHLKNHHPGVPLPKHYVQPFAVILISPWIKIYPEFEGSYIENHDADILGVSARDWAFSFCPDESLHVTPWVSPLDSNAAFWEGVFPKNTLVTCGEFEVMKDDLIRFVRLANISRLHFELDGCHNSLFLDPNLRNHALLLEFVHFIREVLDNGPSQKLMATLQMLDESDKKDEREKQIRQQTTQNTQHVTEIMLKSSRASKL